MLKRFLFLILILPILITCKSEFLKLKQVESTKQVVLKMEYNKKLDKDQISTINFPIEFIVENNSYKKEKIEKLVYLYQPFKEYSQNQTANLYVYKKNKFESLNLFFDDVYIDKGGKKFLIYTKHTVLDTLNFNEDYFAPFINKMRKNKTDSLLMGTLPEFKQKHSKLTQSLLSDDEVIILFNKKVKEVKYNTGEKDNLLLQISKPIKY